MADLTPTLPSYAHGLPEDVLAALRAGSFEHAEGLLAAMSDREVAQLVGQAKLLTDKAYVEYRRRGESRPKVHLLLVEGGPESEGPPWAAR